jgi:hypothetical protein
LRTALLAGLGGVAILILLLLGPIPENPGYHHFADLRTILGVPNFWNVISNALFLLVAMWGLRAFSNRAAFTEAWERHAYLILLGGLALVAFGSGYYIEAANALSIGPGHHQLGRLAVQKLRLIRALQSAVPLRVLQRLQPHPVQRSGYEREV